MKKKCKTVKLWVGRDNGDGYEISSWRLRWYDDHGWFNDDAGRSRSLATRDFHRRFDLRLKPGEQVQIEVPQVKCKILKRLPKEK